MGRWLSLKDTLNAADCTAISGWAYASPDLVSSVRVEIWEGSTFIAGPYLASTYRDDVDTHFASVTSTPKNGLRGNHGFSITTPSVLKNGQPRYISVKISATSTYLQYVYTYQNTQALTCSGAPTGWVDFTGCAAISGWAYDPNNPNRSVTVELWDGSNKIGSLTASIIPDPAVIFDYLLR